MSNLKRAQPLAVSRTFVCAMLTLATLLLGACADPKAPAPSPRQETVVQQPALRPRVAETATAVATSAAATSAPKVAVQAGPPGFIQVAAGENHACALLNSGSVQCWGDNDDGQLDVPEGASFQQITAGYRFSCGILVDGGVTCWGRNDHGQLDAPEGQFTAIDAGWDHVCALSGGTATCWGWKANERATPPTDVEFMAIGAGAEHSCGLTGAQDLRCWGKNDDGRATSHTGPFSVLAVGIAHTCVLSLNGMAQCHGDNSAGQSDAPETQFSNISAGSDHTCGLDPSGSLKCWGGDPSNIVNAGLAAPSAKFQSISAGWQRTCALNQIGEAECWGNTRTAFPSPPFDRLSFLDAMPGYTLDQPTEVFPWPLGGLAVVDRLGSIQIWFPESDPKEVLNIRDQVASDGSLNGMLSAAIDPEFSNFPFLYVFYTLRTDDSTRKESARLSRFPVIDGQVVTGDELKILEVEIFPRPTEGYDGANHYGGQIRFGPDGMLYLGIGDSTCFECPQDLGSLYGKILRIDIRGASVDRPYQIPNDNPFLQAPNARAEIWAYGLRNPYRMAFDPDSGGLWIGDPGQDAEEEVSLAAAGANLGWPIFEGSDCLNMTGDVRRFYGVSTAYPCTENDDVTAPVATYGRIDGCAVIGGVTYRSSTIPWLAGVYLFGDFCSGRVWALKGDADSGWQMIQIADLNHSISSFGTDAAGEVYVLTFGGPILRLVESESKYVPEETIVPSETIVPAAPGRT